MRSRSDKIKILRGFGLAALGLVLFAVLVLPQDLSSFYHTLFSSPQGEGAVVDGGNSIPYRLGSSLALSLLPYSLALLILGFLFIRLTYFLLKVFGETSGTDRNNSEAGASALEFLLVLPLMLALLLVILQLALVIQAKIIVNYAAFCAVRSAIVVIPARVGSRTGNTLSERRNVIYSNSPERSTKMEVIRRAAAFPCLAISPEMSLNLAASTGTFGDAYLDESLLTAKLAIFSPNRDYVKQTVLRWGYAFDRQNTRIEVLNISGNRSSEFKDHGHVTVKVTHRYFLTVPFANRLFGTAYRGGLFAPAFYLPVTEEYTLLNDGEPLFPESQKERFEDYDFTY